MVKSDEAKIIRRAVTLSACEVVETVVVAFILSISLDRRCNFYVTIIS